MATVRDAQIIAATDAYEDRVTRINILTSVDSLVTVSVSFLSTRTIGSLQSIAGKLLALILKKSHSRPGRSNQNHSAGSQDDLVPLAALAAAVRRASIS